MHVLIRFSVVAAILGLAAGEAAAQARLKPGPRQHEISAPPSPLPPPAPPPPPPGQEYSPSARSRVTSGAGKRQARRQPPGYGSVYYGSSHGWDSGTWDDGDHDAWDDDTWEDETYEPRGTEQKHGGATEGGGTPQAYDLRIPAGLTTAVEKTPHGGERASLGAFGGEALDEIPPGATRISVDGRAYYRHDTAFFKPFFLGGRVVYYAVPPPEGLHLQALPEGCESLSIGERTLYTREGVYYAELDGGYVVVDAPVTDDAPPARVTGPEPLALLREMCAWLAGLERFAVSGVDTREETLPTGEVVQLSNWRDIFVSRPSHLFAEVRGDELNRRTWYDGQALTVLDTGRNLYAHLDMPGTLDAALDEMARTYDVTVPLADLLHSGLAERIEKVAVGGRHVGWHSVEGEMCHHLAFTSERVDWEIWIETGDVPRPRQLAITYKQFAGSPRYIATLSRWDAQGAFPESRLAASVPKNAERVDLLPVGAPEAKEAATPSSSP